MTKIVTLSGASGSGKTSIVQALLATGEGVILIPSMTTRLPRSSDVRGEYLHITEDEFLRRKEMDEFLEYDNPHGDWYGTLRSSFEKTRDAGVLGVKAISPQGAEALYRFAPQHVLPCYILPPPEEILRERLKKRGEPPERVEKRIRDCRDWYTASQRARVPYFYIANHTNEGNFSDVLETIRNALVGMKTEKMPTHF